jgi:hypothetical protein
MAITEGQLRSVLELIYEGWKTFRYTLSTHAIVAERIYSLERPSFYKEEVDAGLLDEARKLLSWSEAQLRQAFEKHGRDLALEAKKEAEMKRVRAERRKKFQLLLEEKKCKQHSLLSNGHEEEEELSLRLQVEDGKRLHEALMDSTVHDNPLRPDGHGIVFSVLVAARVYADDVT